MKKLLSLLIICLLLVQLTACGLNSEEKDTGILYLKNPIDNSVTEIKVDSEKVYFANGETLAFQSKLNITEMVESLAEENPDYLFGALDDRQILMSKKIADKKNVYILFSKYVVDENDNPIDDVYVVTSESCYANLPLSKMSICFPYSLTNAYFTFSQEDEATFKLSSNLHEPFFNITGLRKSPTIFTDLVEFYENCGNYRVVYEGGNLTDGQISVYPDNKNVFFPEFQILVIKNEDRMAMKYCAGKDVHELKAEEAVENYVDALNSKNAEAFLNCFKKIDDKGVDVFLNSVKSCKLNSSELFWADQSTDEYVLKVNRTLVSEDGKQMGSLGTGEVDCTDYWLVKLIDGEPKIICQYVLLNDTISELTVYKEFKKNEEDNLVDWLFSITPTE